MFNLFKPKKTTPTVTSILPVAAAQEIYAGRLPILNTDKILLKANETCHYIDKAIYEKKTVKKRYVRKNQGVSIPGFFKGDRIHFGNGSTDVENEIQCDSYRGILYITNQRIIFVGESNGFDKKVSEVVAMTPYTNCIELQFAKENYTLFVPDGNLVHMVLHLI